jgi:hypothetical protein
VFLEIIAENAKERRNGSVVISRTLRAQNVTFLGEFAEIAKNDY